MDAYERVHESLITLGLDTIEHTIDNYLESVGKRGSLKCLTNSFSRK